MTWHLAPLLAKIPPNDPAQFESASFAASTLTGLSSRDWICSEFVATMNFINLLRGENQNISKEIKATDYN